MSSSDFWDMLFVLQADDSSKGKSDYMSRLTDLFFEGGNFHFMGQIFQSMSHLGATSVSMELVTSK